MTIDDGARAKTVLMIAHVAGMVDLVALPVWLGVLVQHYQYDFERAGMTISLFLLCVVAASMLVAPRIHRVPHRIACVAGYAVAAACFALAAEARDPAVMLVMHALAGLGVGLGLSITHGTIGRSANPHRLFAMAGAALGLFAVLFYGVVPPLVGVQGGAALFLVMAALMALAAVASLAFPSTEKSEHITGPAPRLSSTTWLAIAGVVCMTLSQAVIYSFLERIGVTRGFGAERVNMVMLAAGLVNLLPAVLAGLLQRRVAAIHVALCAPLAQAALAITISTSTSFWPYALAGSMYAFVLVFAHTFLFGLLARLDTTGRAVALTPAMLMAGSAIGPALAGVVAQRIGFGGLGCLVLLAALTSIWCFVRVGKAAARSSAALALPA